MIPEPCDKQRVIFFQGMRFQLSWYKSLKHDDVLLASWPRWGSVTRRNRLV